LVCRVDREYINEREKFVLFVYSIGHFIENGLYEKWMSKTLDVIPAKYHIDEQPLKSESIKQLKLKDLQSVFYITIFGLFLAIFMFLFEFIFFALKSLLSEIIN